MKNIIQATIEYEDFLKQHIQVLDDDLVLKHERMRQSKFAFLRATYYRWAELIPSLLPEIVDAPKLKAIGDLHIENFGTFRNASGQLEWAVNDFDEVDNLPYTNDLVRLTASAMLAISENFLAIEPTKAIDAIFQGYRDRITGGKPRPFILQKKGEHFLRKLAKSAFDNNESFWRHLINTPYISIKALPPAASELIRTNVRDKCESLVLHRRVAGVGSLGHRRLVAVCRRQKGRGKSQFSNYFSACELKELGPPATFWINGIKWDKKSLLSILSLTNDPSWKVNEIWLLRRIAPDAVKLQLSMLPQRRKESRLLYLMGSETANKHLVGNPRKVRPVVDDLTQRRDGWLLNAAKKMVGELKIDWQRFKEEFNA